MPEITLVDLDSVDIVREIERAFQVEISDPEAEACLTVGDLFDLIVSKTRVVETGADFCLSARAFWRLRAAAAQSGVTHRVTPETSLAGIMPRAGRRAWWNKLSRTSGMKLPAPPPGISMSVCLFIGLTGAAVTVVCGRYGEVSWAALAAAAAISGFCVLTLLHNTSDRLGMTETANFGDLAKAAGWLNPGALAGPSDTMRRRDLWEALTAVIRDFTQYAGPIDKRTRFKTV